jgi:L-threonylcarbamoyladenylate synthase
MKTVHLFATEAGAIANAAHMLQDGKLVVFPTDTVYGVGAHAFLEEAIDTLYLVKQRSRDKGIPLLLADIGDLEKVAGTVPDVAAALITRFWPGPLTLIVPRHTRLPANVSPNDNVAVRIPDNDVARALIRASGGAVAASSANRSGAPPARDAQTALAILGGEVAAVVDGGPAPLGAPSTIVDCTATPPQLLRSGPLTTEELGLDRK